MLQNIIITATATVCMHFGNYAINVMFTVSPDIRLKMFESAD